MKLKSVAIGALTFILVGVIWELLAAINFYNTELFPPPSEAILAILKLWESGVLATDFADSMSRYLPGFLIGSSVGVVMGVVSGISRGAGYVVNPLFHYLRAIPPVALIPFMLVLFGITDVGKVSLVAWACMFPVWLSTQAGMKQVPVEYLRAAEVFGVKGFRRIFDVWLPCSLPHILSGLRIAVATGFFALAAAEMFASSSGIAFRIVYSHQLFQTDTMVGMILFVGLIALSADLLLGALRKSVARWEDV